MEKNSCAICGKEYEGNGHNPEPLVIKGRCCTACNVTKVIPIRISLHYLGKGDHPQA